jgi:predicted GIY-YIG superfamily endonuclease
MIYLLHFSMPISDRHTTQHYLGYTSDLDTRIRDHRRGKGSRLCEVAKERGIGFTLVEVLEGDRNTERSIKASNNLKRYCPICQKSKTTG